MQLNAHTSIKPFVAVFIVLFGLSTFSSAGHAQNAPAASRQVRILQIEPETLTALDNLAAQTDVGAVSVSVSLAELRARPAALKALATWVHEGGVVFLHTDVAQLFGYSTVVAREGTARVAGQLFGRARAALSFAGHPLLWGSTGTGALAGILGGSATAASSATAAGSATAGGSVAARAADTLGVRLVFYQMMPGDRLVLEHPAGVPLLLVTDLAAPSTTSQFAAAIAPYGAGWAVFTPSLVEQHRADGAVFVQNLLRLMGSSPKVVARSTPAGTAGTLTSLPAAFVESSAERMRQAQNAAFDAAALGRELVAAWRPATPVMVTDEGSGVQIPRADSVARLMLTQGELAMLASVINASAANEAARPRVAAMLYVLRARLELQRNDLRVADAWMTLAEQAAPDIAEVALWRGVVLAAQAEDKMLDSASRANLLNGATTRWAQALAAPSLTGVAATTDTAAGIATTAPSISGIPTSLIRLWSTAAATSARLVAVEPPLVTQLGTAANSVILRHFPNDPALRFALPAAQVQARSVSTLGWNVPEEEILIFPTSDYYTGYRRALGAGLRSPTGPLTQYGDVAGNHILLAAPFSMPVVLPPAAPGQPPRTVQMGSTTPAVLARLHAHVLINALAEGGTSVPEWMQLGLMALNNAQIQSELLQSSINSQEFNRLAAGGGLLSPAQFRGVPTRTITANLAEVQAARMMSFFYARYGAGRIVETLQRLGAGDTIDEALDATVGISENEFFTAWYNAEFGNRR